MPQPMAEALGWPDAADRLRRPRRAGQRPRGLGVARPPRVGSVPTRQDQPELLDERAQLHHRRVLRRHRQVQRADDRGPRPPGRRSSSPDQIESSVVHYGDITMTFLNNWFAQDVRGTSLTYASAVAVEEKSVIDYNLGNPDGVLSPGEEPRVPRVPLVAIYPEEGTLFSDNPFIILDTEWVDDDEQAAAAAFEEYVQTPGEPGQGDGVRVPAEQPGGRPRRPDRGRPTASTRTSRPPSCEVPAPDVLVRHPRRLGRAPQGGPRPARARHLRVDGRPGRRRARPSSTSPWRRRPARSTSSRTPTRSGCGCSAPTSAATTRTSASSCRWRRSASNRDVLEEQILAQFPTNGTPLYDVTGEGVRGDARDLRPSEDQRRRAAHRRRERRRRPERRRRAVRRAHRDAADRAARARARGRCACSRSPTARRPTW